MTWIDPSGIVTDFLDELHDTLESIGEIQTHVCLAPHGECAFSWFVNDEVVVILGAEVTQVEEYYVAEMATELLSEIINELDGWGICGGMYACGHPTTCRIEHEKEAPGKWTAPLIVIEEVGE